MKIKMATLYSKVLSVLLATLGLSLSSCAEYGTPYAFIKVNGKVVDKESKKPIPGIGVVLDNVSNAYRNDTVFTDDSGVFIFNREIDFAGPMTFNVTIQDMDGKLNGEYLDQGKVIEIKKSDYKGGSGEWYSGEAVVDMKQIELTPKKENE